MSTSGTTPDLQSRLDANARAFTDRELVAAWCRWSPQLSTLLSACTDAVLQAATLVPGRRILDLASGTGDPAIALARAVAPSGEVIATDISEDILSCAKQRAEALGASNMRFERADAQALHFTDETFDAVTCRFGIMYFVDPVATLQRAWQLLRPSGRVVLLSWGTAEQPYFACTRGIVERRLAPPASPDAPDTFAFSAPGTLRQALHRAGFDEIEESPLNIQLCWPGSPETLWQFMQELTVSFQALARQEQRRWAEITAEVLSALQPYVHGDSVILPAEVNLAVAVKRTDPASEKLDLGGLARG